MRTATTIASRFRRRLANCESRTANCKRNSKQEQFVGRKTRDVEAGSESRRIDANLKEAKKARQLAYLVFAGSFVVGFALAFSFCVRVARANASANAKQSSHDKEPTTSNKARLSLRLWLDLQAVTTTNAAHSDCTGTSLDAPRLHSQRCRLQLQVSGLGKRSLV